MNVPAILNVITGSILILTGVGIAVSGIIRRKR